MFKKKSTKDDGKTFFVRSGKWRNWSYKMSEVISTKVVKTRKPHVCFGCGREFPAGTEMRKDFVVDVKAFSCYLCETCEKITYKMDYDDEFGYGELREEALELERLEGLE